jgi:hypothetical protein
LVDPTLSRLTRIAPVGVQLATWAENRTANKSRGCRPKLVRKPFFNLASAVVNPEPSDFSSATQLIANRQRQNSVALSTIKRPPPVASRNKVLLSRGDQVPKVRGASMRFPKGGAEYEEEVRLISSRVPTGMDLAQASRQRQVFPTVGYFLLWTTMSDYEGAPWDGP